MAKGPERLVRWIMGHTQPVPYSLDIEHPVMDDIAWAADEIEWLRNESQSLRERVERDLIEMRIGNATPCDLCRGLGVRAYGSTATWRGGGGGQAITSDVCDRCWGSGTADRPWPSHRNLSREGERNG